MVWVLEIGAGHLFTWWNLYSLYYDVTFGFHLVESLLIAVCCDILTVYSICEAKTSECQHWFCLQRNLAKCHLLSVNENRLHYTLVSRRHYEAFDSCYGHREWKWIFC